MSMIALLGHRYFQQTWQQDPETKRAHILNEEHKAENASWQ